MVHPHTEFQQNPTVHGWVISGGGAPTETMIVNSMRVELNPIWPGQRTIIRTDSREMYTKMDSIYFSVTFESFYSTSVMMMMMMMMKDIE